MRRVLALIVLLAVIGCADGGERSARQVPPDATPRARYVPPPDRFPRSALLTFDSPDDLAFVDRHDVEIGVDPERPDNRAWATRGDSIKLGALLRGRPFPGPWDLVGFRVRSEVATRGTVELNGGGFGSPTPPVAFEVQPGGWRTLWFDVARLSAVATTRPTESVASDDLLLTIATPDRARLLIDDLVLAQGRTTLSESAVPKTGERWLVRRVGSEWQALFGEDIVLRLPSLPFAVDGFRAVEAGPTRVLFATADEGRTICIDRTGRLIEDGRTRLDPAVIRHGKAIAENASPARIEVLGDVGRVDRALPGDHDNDGYDETRGCYCVRAQAGRVAFRLTRQRATVRWPVVEVAGLPAGPVNVWLEGQVVPWTTRLGDGRVVIELPIDLERPVEVQVRVK